MLRIVALPSSAVGNAGSAGTLAPMTSVETIAKPIARAIKIYRSVARHDLDLQTRRGLARHIKRLADEGVRDPNRLTVHGLSYLRDLERRERGRFRDQ
jgi:hypothetical protein